MRRFPTTCWWISNGENAARHALALDDVGSEAVHRDPFDRLITAQAVLERLPILTADTQMGRYDVEAIEAT